MRRMFDDHHTFNFDTVFGEAAGDDAVYGGTAGYVADKGGTYDEPGYVANPPCVFEANSTRGLPEPPLMNGMTIRGVHVTNSTYGHHGEMALPQAMLAYDVYG